jgi:hypothetical protein
MLADSMMLGKDGDQIREHVDQPYLDERSPGCARVAVPRTILPEDLTEPRTGIKFPTLLEENSNPTAEVLFPALFVDNCVMHHSPSFQSNIVSFPVALLHVLLPVLWQLYGHFCLYLVFLTVSQCFIPNL